MTWERLALADLADVQGGIQKQPKRAPRLNAHPFLRVANVTSRGLDLSDVHRIELFGDELERLRLERGDLLVVEGNGSASQIGRAAVWDGSIGDCVHQNHLIRVRSRGRVLPPFLGLVWNAPAVRDELTAVSSSTSGLHTLSVSKLKRIVLPVPPMREQERIVELVEGHLSGLDAAADYESAALSRITSLREALIRRALIGADLSGRRCRPGLADAGTQDGVLATLPVGWEWRRLGEIADVVGGVTKDAKKQSLPGLVEVPYLRVANVQRGALRLDQVTNIRVTREKAESLRLRAGDVLLNEGGDRNKLARGWVWEDEVADCIHQNHVFRARISGELDPYFLSWTANTMGGRWAEVNGKQSVNLASISLSMIRRMPVVVPPPGVSGLVVAQLRSQLEDIDRMRRAAQKSQARGIALRRAVLAAAFEGKLTGRSTDAEVIEELAGV